MNIGIRPARTEDVASLRELMNALDSETEFMLYEPGERAAYRNHGIRTGVLSGSTSGC